ncbi:MAG: hypothetical protein A2219_03475 [Elusimicrobia bacterium RIFOXYA2_FULL_50_26]|nr:MAG: hypothetical protein A2219_03475 [Elusimicrobia bacterium RIFOXYA2_FULL_50_26]OGS25357.1 MAG: hypothetical protein A2314_06465 [Elusimicrobia bacterium RIFOXYB2_FULL_50_12]
MEQTSNRFWGKDHGLTPPRESVYLNCRQAPGRIKLAGSPGIALITVLFIAFFVLSTLLYLSFRAIENSRSLVTMVKTNQAAFIADAGVQRGLAALEKKLSRLEERINLGILQGDGTYVPITYDNVATYTKADPALRTLFWTEWLNYNPLNAADPANADLPQSLDFVIEDSKYAVMRLNETLGENRYEIVVRLFDANAPLSLNPRSITAKVNDVTMRYGFEVESTPINAAGVRGKTVTVRSHTSIFSDRDRTINVHLARLLSKYNLFTIYNTIDGAIGGTRIYDSVSYTGDVYSTYQFYSEGDAKYDGSMMVSNIAADPPVIYYNPDGTTIGLTTVKKSDGSDNSVRRVDEKFFPDNITADKQRRAAYYGRLTTAAIPALSANTIFLDRNHTNVLCNDGSIESMDMTAYITGSATVEINNLGPDFTTTQYIITTVSDTETVEQYVWKIADPYFLIYANGDLTVKGEVSNKSKTTLAATNTVYISGSVKYGGGIPNADTVISLISWNQNVLVKKDAATDANELTLHAVVMTPQGGFGVEGYLDIENNYTAYAGLIRHCGSFLRHHPLPTLNSARTKGWGLETEFDTALAQMKAPPFFPGEEPYELKEPQKARVVELYRAQ